MKNLKSSVFISVYCENGEAVRYMWIFHKKYFCFTVSWSDNNNSSDSCHGSCEFNVCFDSFWFPRRL